MEFYSTRTEAMPYIPSDFWQFALKLNQRFAEKQLETAMFACFYAPAHQEKLPSYWTILMFSDAANQYSQISDMLNQLRGEELPPNIVWVSLAMRTQNYQQEMSEYLTSMKAQGFENWGLWFLTKDGGEPAILDPLLFPGLVELREKLNQK